MNNKVQFVELDEELLGLYNIVKKKEYNTHSLWRNMPKAQKKFDEAQFIFWTSFLKKYPELKVRKLEVRKDLLVVCQDY